MNSTNLTSFGFNQSHPLILSLKISTVSLRFLLSFSLNCYIIFLLLSREGHVDLFVVFWVNNAVAEVLLSILSLLHLLFIENSSLFVVILLGCLTDTNMSAHHLFLCCVCLERYLAVVHPVTFLRFKSLRYRVACSVLVWICALLLANITNALPLTAHKLWFAVNIITVAVEFFCCVSILRRLRDPGPRNMVSEQGEMNAAKKKAFQIVFINLLTCLAQYIPLALTHSLENVLSDYKVTMAEIISIMIGVFVTCVQPVFFLYKAGKLSFMNCS